MRRELTYFMGFWLVAWLVMFLSFLTILDPMHAIRNSSGFILPLILPVALLEWCFIRFFYRKQFLIYGILTLLTIAGFGLINFYLIKYLVNDPEAESNTVLSIVIFFLVFRGIKFFIRGARQQLALNESKARQLEVTMKLQQLEASKIKAELEAIKSQVNPHFLYNTLNAVYSLVLQRSASAGDAILQLASLMRYVLESSKNEWVALGDEIQFINDYLSLERLRLEDRCKIIFTVELNNTDITIAPLLFLPLVENCFKHGIGLDRKNNLIEIDLRVSGHNLVFSTKNHVRPQTDHSSETVSGKSLENLRKRLDLLYPGMYTYHVEMQETEYITELIIQLR